MLKAYIGTTAILLAAVGFLFWQNSSKGEELGELQAELKATHEAHKLEVNRLNAALISQKLVVDQLEAEIDELDQLLAANRKTQNEIARRNQNLQQQLRDLKDAKPEVKDYLDQSVPDDIARLFLKPSGAASSGDKDKTPSRVIDDGDRSSVDNRGNDQAKAEESRAAESLSRHTSQPPELQRRQSRSQNLEIQSGKSSVRVIEVHLANVLIIGSSEDYPLQASSSPVLQETVNVKFARQLEKAGSIVIQLEHSEEQAWLTCCQQQAPNQINSGELSCFTV